MSIARKSLILISVFLSFLGEIHGQCEFLKTDSLSLESVFIKYNIVDYVDFASSKAPLDIVVLMTSGGSERFDYLRLTKTDSETIKLFNGDSSLVLKREMELDDIIKLGDFIGLCPYSSGNNSVMACVKLNGEAFFTFHMVDGAIGQLPFEEYRILLTELIRLGNTEFGSP